MLKTIPEAHSAVNSRHLLSSASSLLVKPAPSESLQNALEYASQSFHLLPKMPGTKDNYGDLGVYDATDDQDHIREWSRKWPTCNWAYHPGAMGLVVIDFDTIDPFGFLSSADLRTQIVQTPTNYHLLYRQPPGAQIGCSRGSLPRGIDVKGIGGLAMLPGAMVDGRTYAWLKGHSPKDLPIAPLPHHIAAMIAQAPTSRTEGPGAQLGDCGAAYDLAMLPDAIQSAIHSHTRKGERSTIDFSVCCALVELGASDAQIVAIFDNFPVGAKHRERVKGDYLAATLRNARARTVAHRSPRAALVDPSSYSKVGPRDHRALVPLSPATHSILELLIAEATRKDSDTFLTSLRGYASQLNVTHRTIHRQLCGLRANGWITTSTSSEGTKITLTAKAKSTQKERGVGGGYFLLRTNVLDVFARADYRTAQYRRNEAGPLLPSLGPSGRAVIEVLANAAEALTVGDIAAHSGRCDSTVRNVLTKLNSMGLLFIPGKRGKMLTYELAPNVEARLVELAPDMVTFGIGNLRAGQHNTEIALWAHRQLEKGAELPHIERGALLRRKERAWAKAAVCYAKACADFKLPYDPHLPRHQLIHFFKYLSLRAGRVYQLRLTIDYFT